jgi:uncharacterized SAM-binding protein YcdF (DUF218 family)
MRRARLQAALTQVLRGARRLIRRAVMVAGGLALVMALLAFTSVPWRMHVWLGVAAGELETVPDRIVVLGGSGMPSGPELLRLYHAADLAQRFPHAQVDVIHTPDTAVLRLMVAELLLRGVAPERIHPQAEGTNTRGQALAFWRSGKARHNDRLALITAPENMYRTVRTFRKVGFPQAAGVPAWDTPLFSDLGYRHRALGGRRFVPDVSHSYAVRYDLWNRLKLQITCYREFMAILYYRLNGWV